MTDQEPMDGIMDNAAILNQLAPGACAMCGRFPARGNAAIQDANGVLWTRLCNDDSGKTDSCFELFRRLQELG